MICKKQSTSTMRCVAKIGVMLAVVTALFLCIGAGAVSAGTPSSLPEAFDALNTQDSVVYTVTDNEIIKSSADIKKIVNSTMHNLISTTTTQPKKTIKIVIPEGCSIEVQKNTNSVQIVGENNITINRNDMVTTVTVENPILGTAVHGSSDTLKVTDLEINTLKLDQSGGKEKTYAYTEGGKGVISINGQDFKVEDFDLNILFNDFVVTLNSNTVHAESTNVDGQVTFTSGNQIVTYDNDKWSCIFDANYDKSLTAKVLINAGYLTYPDSTHKVAISDVNGSYTNGKLSLSGIAELRSDMTLPVTIPVPSFVNNVSVILNNHVIDNVKGNIFYKPSETVKEKVIFYGTATFKNVVNDHEKIGIGNGYKWNESSYKAILINESSIEADANEVVGINVLTSTTSTALVCFDSPAVYSSQTDNVPGSISNYQIGSTILKFNVSSSYSGVLTVSLSPDVLANVDTTKIKLAHKTSSGAWELIGYTGSPTTSTTGWVVFNFAVKSFSPFALVTTEYIGGGGSSGGTGGSYIEKTITPYPTATPTPTPTQGYAIPTTPSKTTTTTSKSPVPVFGLIAGLGAAAFFLYRRG